MKNKKKKKGFPDLNKDGKVTFKDILIGRGVIKKNKGGSLKGGQKKLDANKDGKISGEDFAMLRNKKPVKAVAGLFAKGKRAKEYFKLLGNLPAITPSKFAERGMKLSTETPTPSEFVRRRMILSTKTPSTAKRAEEFVPKSRVKEAGTRGFLYGTGATAAGLGITGAKIEERDFKKARQEKETKERTATEGSFKKGKMIKAMDGEMVGIDLPQDFENLPDLNDLPEVSKPITQNERRQQIIRDRSTKKILDQLRTPAMRLDPRKKMGGGMMNEDPMGYKSGGAIEVGKGKDYIKDLL